VSTPYELVNGYRRWVAGRSTAPGTTTPGALPIERCEQWWSCPMCLAELGNDHHILWQEGRNPLASIKPAQPWNPAQT
jgi:hypothetical protein